MQQAGAKEHKLHVGRHEGDVEQGGEGNHDEGGGGGGGNGGSVRREEGAVGEDGGYVEEQRGEGDLHDDDEANSVRVLAEPQHV